MWSILKWCLSCQRYSPLPSLHSLPLLQISGLGPYTAQVFSVIFFFMLICVALGSSFGDFNTVTTAIFDHRSGLE